MRTHVVILYVLTACGAGNPDTPDAGAAADDAPAAVDAVLDPLAACGPVGAGWTRCAADPLVSGSTPFLDGGIAWTQADPTVLYDPDDRRWKAWWSTVVTPDCHEVFTTREIDIMYADSPDGVHWSRQAEPVLRSHRNPAKWDDSTVETPTVIRRPGAPVDRRFALVYAGGNDATLQVLGQTGWQLGVAFSRDGKQFTRISAAESPYAHATTPFGDVEGLVLLAKDAFPSVAGVDRGIVADPELVVRGTTYHLYFSSVGVDASGAFVTGTYGISHATSTDLVHWTARPDNPITTLQGGAQPTIVDDGTTMHMWFGQDSTADTMMIPSVVFPTLGFWAATSSDGNTWTRTGTARDFAWLPSSDAENFGLLNGAAAVRGPDGALRLYYTAWGNHVHPAGSCVYTQTGVAEGTNNLLLAIKR